VKALTIRLYDCTDWGCAEATDEDRAAYEQAVADAIGEAYPGADVTVQYVASIRPRVCVTTRDESGRILTDVATAKAEIETEEHVIAIVRHVWDIGAFWLVAAGA